MSKPKIVVKNELMGAGCFIQLIAIVVAVFGFALGPVIGLIGLALAVGLFVYGSGQGQKWVCSECRNPLDSRKVKVCPVCRASF